MIEQEIKEELEKELNQVNIRLEILDMIEDRLIQMKELAERVINGHLTDEEMEKLNKQVQDLKSQVSLLNSEATMLS